VGRIFTVDALKNRRIFHFEGIEQRYLGFLSYSLLVVNRVLISTYVSQGIVDMYIYS